MSSFLFSRLVRLVQGSIIKIRSERALYYFYKIKFKEKSEFTARNYEQVGARPDRESSKEKIETLLNEQKKKKNTTKKTLSDIIMKIISSERFLLSINKENVEFFQLCVIVHLFCAVGNDECMAK